MRLAASLSLLLLVAPGVVAAAPCNGPISGSGRAANPMNFDPPRTYDMEARAKALAIADWRGRARRQCTGASSEWAQATNKKLDCEGYAGGLACTATAIPASKP